MSSNTRKNIILILLVVCVTSMTIVFAVMSSTLSIGGTVTIPQATWDIHFANFSSSSTPETTSLGESNTGVLKSVSTNATAITSLKVDLKKPGDKIVYTFDIVNNGSINARLSTFTKSMTCEVDNSCGYANYDVVCTDSNSNTVSIGSNLPKNTSYNCSATIEYDDSYNSLSDDVAASLSANFQFVQN